MLTFLKNKFISIPIVIFTLIIIFVFVFGFLPAAKVSGKIITYSQFLKVLGAIETFNKISNSFASSSDAVSLKKQTLENIVDQVFLDILIEKTDPALGKKAEDLVAKTLEENKNLNLASASEKLYGLTPEDFQKLILLPQAKKDVLADYYKDNPGELARRIQILETNVEIKIYYPGFYWDNGEVKIK